MMSIKLITAKAFSTAVEVNDSNIIVNAPKIFQQFINVPLSTLLDTLKRNKFQSLTVEDVEETE
jgi:hypothetical protein